MSNDFLALVEKYKKKQIGNRLGISNNSGTVTVQTSTSKNTSSKSTSSKSTSSDDNDFWALVDKYKQEDVSNRLGSSLDTRTRVWDKLDDDEEDEDDIAPVKDEKLDFFQKGSFKDGYQIGDVTKAILGTAGDAGLNIAKGFAGIAEGIGDLVAYGAAGVADAIGKDRYADETRKRASENMVNKMTQGAEDYLNKYSVLGRTSDSAMQGVGQVGAVILTGGLGAAAGLGAAGTTALTTGVMGLTGMGSGMGEAYQEGATDLQALKHGLNSGTADALSELIFGGLGKAVNALGFSRGLTSADDMLAKVVGSKFKNQAAKNIVEFGIKAGAEGLEEVIAGIAQAISKHNTYMSDEDLADILKDENLLEQFVVGAVTSGVAQAPGLHIANTSKTDFITGQTQNEQAVIKKEVENRIAEAEKDGKKLTAKEKSKIESQVEQDMEKGYISTDTIEEVLGGETYMRYKKTVDRENDLEVKRKALQEEFDTLNKMKQGEMTGEQIDRRTDLKEEIAKLNQTIESTKNHSPRDLLKKRLSDSVSEMVRSDRLIESYNERTRRSQAFEADLTKYDEKQKAVIQTAVDSGILNNTNRTHEFVDLVAKMSADKGVLFDFTNNEKLKESGFAVEGKFVNAYVNNGKITLNMDSSKAWQTTVGHEITHVLEGTDLYAELQKVVLDYAKTKGEYQSRYDTLSKLYEGVKGANIDAELTADLVGDYLFTDADFINNLSTNHRNVFQKIYDEVKYLLKVATAGSKEAKELEKVKRAFEKAYRENAQNQTEENEFDTDDVQYSISVEDKETLDSLNEQVSRGEYDPDTNPNGGYYTTYKSMSFWGYDEDGNAILRSPMAEYVDGELSNAYLMPKDKSKLNWYQATETIDESTGFPTGLLVRTKKPGNKSYSYVPAAENQDLIQEDWGNLFFNLKKKVYKNGKWTDSDVPARYNPYEHSSNSMLNDQFSTAYLRDNLVTVKMIVPVSEDNGTFRAKWSKDPTGWTDWKTGTVASKINKQKDLQRRVFLSRYAAPVEIVSDSEVAQAYKSYVEGTDVAIPDNVVSPNLLAELRNAGVPITESGKVKTPVAEDSVKVLKGGSVTKYSLSTWTPEMQAKVSNNLTKAGFEKADVDKWIKDTNSIAAKIAEDKARLDFEAHENHTMVKDNNEYYKTVEASTLCAKRLEYQGTFDAIQHRLPNTTLTSDMLIELREMMKKHGREVPCGACYVESRRRHLGKYATDWLKTYDGEFIPTLADVTTTDGLENLRLEHPDTYNDFIAAMNKKGVSNPKVVELRTEYKGEIMKIPNSTYQKIMKIGGLRLQSFSDFETPHLLDMMQVVNDMASRKFVSQAYTKVPNFAWVLGDTNIKINLSLIPGGTGIDANGELIFDPKEGMDINEAMQLRDRYSKNVGTTIIGINDEHILKCMADDRIDYIIPFHRSGWGSSELSAMGLDSYVDYTKQQRERDIETKKGVENIDEMSYWDFSKTGKENAEAYLQLCAEKGVIPKFEKFLVDNGDGSYSLQPDGSTDGYWKTLINFKMYDNDGVGSPHQAVVPNFNMEEAYRVLDEYKGGANSLPVADDVVEEFVAKYNENVAPTKYSLSDSNGNQLTQDQAEYFKDSVVRDENGNLKVMYHGTSNGGHTVFDPWGKGRYGLFGIGSYFTDNKDIAQSYTKKGRGNNPQVYETYLNIKNPMDMDAPANPSEWAKAFPDAYFPEFGTNEDFYRAMEEYFEDEGFVRWEAEESAMDALFGMGYDGITHIGGGRVNPNGERHRVYIAFNPEQIKNMDNLKPTTDPDIRYSLSEDNEGNQLTEEQDKFFKDSQIRDRDGNLRRVYHTTKNDFTVFDKARKGEATDGANTFLGFFFAESPDHMEQFPEFQNGRTDAYYLNMKKPMDLTNLSKESFMDIVELTGGDRIEAAEAYDQELEAEKARARMRGDSNTALSIGQLLYNMVGDYYQADFFDALKPNYDKLVAKGYDGVIDYLDEMMGEREFVVFDSNQAKLTTNTKPTDDPDIRHSLSSEGEEHPVYGNYNVPLRDLRLDNVPVTDDIAPHMDNWREAFDSITDKDAPPVKETDPVKEISTVAERVKQKIINAEAELEKNRQFRDQTVKDYDAEIAKAQAELDSKKKLDSKVAQTLRRRIERLNRLKADINADYGKRISDLEKRVEKLHSKEYSRAEYRRDKQEGYTKMWEDMIGDTSTWKDMPIGLQYKTKTLRRILRKVVKDANGNPDFLKADRIYDELETKYDHNEALLKRESQKLKEVFSKLNLNHVEDTYAHMLGELKHNPDTTLTEDRVKEYYDQHKEKIDTKKVDTAIIEARKTFDDLIVRVNNVLREQGMKEIPYRKGYFPHFTNPKQGLLAKLLNWKTIDTEIPTSIAGLTEAFKPQRSWQSFNKQRMGDTTDYSLYQGLDTYIHGALDWIYHIEDLQKRRALENHIRYTHSEEGIKERIKEIKAGTYDADEAQAMIDAVLKEANNPLSGLVRELMNRTNTLANKKSSMDRGMEDATNRKIYSTMTNLNNRINANMVVGSFSSALTNFIPMVQSWHQVSPYYTVKGLSDYIRSTVVDDGIVAKSDYLTNRLVEEEKLYQTGWDKISDKAAFMMNAFDSITSQTVWRSKYLQNLKEGMSEDQAIKDADQFAKNLMAGRSRGNAPTIFDAKNPIVKIFTAFQLEVANQYGFMFEDTPQDTKNKARLVKGYATAFLGSYLYNALYSSLVGRDAAFDPIGILEDLLKDLFGDDDDEEENPTDALLAFGENVAQEVPFIGGLLGGGRVPISSALPYSNDQTPFESMLTDVTEGNWDSFGKELMKPLYYLAMPVAGGQIKKTFEGLRMFSDDHPIAGSYTDSGKLRFPVEDTFANKLQAGLFGQYSSKNARDYFDNERSPLGEKQLQEFIDVDLPIRDYWDYREGLSGLKTVEEKADYIADLDLPVSKKNILINNVTDRKEPIDLADFDQYSSLEEMDFAKNNPEKYEIAQAVGGYQDYLNYKEGMKDMKLAEKVDYVAGLNLTTEQKNILINGETDRKEPIDLTGYENFSSFEEFEEYKKDPESYALSKAVGGYEAYKAYSDALGDIHADKDEFGNSIRDSRKAKVQEYIESLDADYYTKLILYKSEYTSYDDENYEIIEYLNNREDISFEEMNDILRKLDFDVDSEGNIYW